MIFILIVFAVLIFVGLPLLCFAWWIFYTLLDIAFYWLVWALVQVGVKVSLNKYSYLWLNLVGTVCACKIISNYFPDGSGVFWGVGAGICGVVTLFSTINLWVKE